MMFAPLVVPLLLLFAPLLSSKDLPRFVEEEEPELRSRLAQLQLLDHRGPVRSRRSSQLPQYTDVICEAAHGKAGGRNRICFLENVCYNLKAKRLQMAKEGFREGFREPGSRFVVDLSSYREAPVFHLHEDGFTTLPTARRNVSVLHLANPTVLLTRFFPYNIMHALHDDFLPTLMLIAAVEELRETDKDVPRLLVSLDDTPAGKNEMLYDWLGQHLRAHEIPQKMDGEEGRGLDYVCFEQAVAGLSTSTTWYQYGYKSPQGQGPIESMNRTFVGTNVRTGIDWLKERLHMTRAREHPAEHFRAWLLDDRREAADKQSSMQETRPVISVLSRKGTRLMLNEDALVQHLQSVFPAARVRLLRQEETELEELFRAAHESVAMVGMHGALMAIAAFLPPGAVLVELFPFGIPAENYTPYKTMAELPGMDIAYRVWVNPLEDPAFNRGHFYRSYTSGGIHQYPESYQHGILATKTVPRHRCCYSPFWIYRIFQDTAVDCSEVTGLVREAMMQQIRNHERMGANK